MTRSSPACSTARPPGRPKAPPLRTSPPATAVPAGRPSSGPPGEALAVQRDTEGIRPWPPEGWAAVVLAGAAAAYGVRAAIRVAEEKRAKG